MLVNTNKSQGGHKQFAVCSIISFFEYKAIENVWEPNYNGVSNCPQRHYK